MSAPATTPGPIPRSSSVAGPTSEQPGADLNEKSTTREPEHSFGAHINPSVDPVDLVDFDGSSPQEPHDSAELPPDIGLVSGGSRNSRFSRFSTEIDAEGSLRGDIDLTEATSTESAGSSSDSASGAVVYEPEALQLLNLVGTEDDPYKDGGKWAYAAEAGGRCFFVTQNERYTDGRVLLTEDAIEGALARKGMTRSAWIKHDKDVITEDDLKRNPAAVLGARKADHFHVAVDCKSFASIAQIARAFGVPPQCVESKPPSAFMDLVEYLTHENPSQTAKGKHLYSRSEVHASFADWEEQLDDHKLARSFKAGKRANEKKKEALMLAVMYGDKTLRQVRQEEPVIYGKNLDAFKKWRADFLLSQEAPRMRTNHYIGGKLGEMKLGRTGKTQLARLLARALYPDLDAAECYHEATDKRVPLQNYHGQPVIIWDDYHPVDLMTALGGRTGVWQVFDDHPGTDDVNIKYGSVRLVHEVNIITRVTPYREYLDQLAGEYVDVQGVRHFAEDRRQAYGRFPFVHEVTASEIGVYVNSGFVKDTREFSEFVKLAVMKANMQQIGAALDRIESDEEREAARIEVGNRLLGPVLEQHRALQPVADLSKEEALALVMPSIEVQTPGVDMSVAPALPTIVPSPVGAVGGKPFHLSVDPPPGAAAQLLLDPTAAAIASNKGA